MEIIKLENISKTFQVYQRKPGLLNTVKSLIKREFTTKTALDSISLSIQPGEVIGYIGPNGAGKSTTIKILSGILVPTQGYVNVNGLVPYANRKQNALKIGVVFGQRTHLHWDLPVMDSYYLYKKMYKIDNKTFKNNVDFFVEKLEMQSFIYSPVRILSLGQKMRAEIASALLHDPKILFLDEPTIGLDVMAKNWIREFLKQLNNDKNITIMLTTHDMDDIECICKRIIIIDKGKILYDGNIDTFKKQYSKECEVTVDYETEPNLTTDNRLLLVNSEGLRYNYKFNLSQMNIAEVISILSERNIIKDFSYREQRIDSIIRGFYTNSN